MTRSTLLTLAAIGSFTLASCGSGGSAKPNQTATGTPSQSSGAVVNPNFDTKTCNTNGSGVVTMYDEQSNRATVDGGKLGKHLAFRPRVDVQGGSLKVGEKVFFTHKPGSSKAQCVFAA